MPSPRRPTRRDRSSTRAAAPPARPRARAAVPRGAASVADQLEDHLGDLAIPFLFVGSGLSIRYAGADNWEGLLRRFASETTKPYEFYSSSANGILPDVATLIAREFHELWWNDPAYENRRQEGAALVTGTDSALKVEVSRYLLNLVDELPTSGPLAEEIALLGAAVVDGIITTNYDSILEHIRSDFAPYVGQDELLFSNPQGIAEIYKIHGSCTNPNSLVLTAADYQRYNERNAYLVAKLLTIFVEHPVLFLGYSLGDPNIQDVLVAIARCLTDERIEDLRDRLIFVEWQDGSSPSMTATVVSASGFTIPIQKLIVPDYRDVFEVLGKLKPRIPARVVRHLRQQIFELVQTSTPTDRVFVEHLAPDADLADIEVYAGVGVQKKLASVGLVGLTREDLVDDVLNDAGYDAQAVVLQCLPVVGRSTQLLLPVFKYLRGGGFLKADGSLADPSLISPRVVARVENRESYLTSHGQSRETYSRRAERLVASGVRSVADLVSATDTAIKALYVLPYFPQELIDPSELRSFLLAHHDIFDAGGGGATYWVRGVCLYDWLVYGRAGT